MLKIGKGINTLFLRQGLIVDLLDKVNHIRMGMEFPDRGFHTLLETQFETQDDYVVTWAWVTGGLGNGIKYTVAVATGGDGDTKAGWTQGHKDYVFVRPIPQKFVNAIRNLTPEQLYLIGQISGFDSAGHHKDGWHSRGLFAARLALPDCLCADDEPNQPEVWRIKEGVFILFPDDTYRLMTFADYFWLRNCWDRPDFRQGDLLFYKADMHLLRLRIENMVNEGETIRVDRHVITAQTIRLDQATKTLYLFGKVRVEHPEHGVLDMPDGVYTYSLLPGTSRPFRGGID